MALVTGAGQGVGRQTVTDLVRRGIAGRVVVNDYVADRAETVAEELRDLGAEAIAAPFDVTDGPAVQEAVARATAEFGGIDILVNNAGNSGTAGHAQDQTAFWESAPSDWLPWIGVNFTGVLHCTHAVVGGMVERRYGRIVTVISEAGRVGEPNYVVYSGAKAGAAGFTRAIGGAAGRYGVTANCVSLGATRTPATAQIDEMDDKTTRRILSGYAVKRFGESADASAAICFFAGEDAGWITKQTLPVNGGYSNAL
ncbi:SDR family NAD(P)-dependent oxidoreductase [Rhodococcus sp. T2V]|uniref:SDR family NAD(P)-dependent oxidoreductase n=1 Tax=Rhodococcus sp. T2V TaxID=3034164 RepID=UPI0023E0CFB7|nr:SDR family NAD(P)-dependent oxidoreductase [Rhodococcus sp. T2V]MDF3312053.1 SDR family NAD(P)-dependent oxidoreductase [Rhodococcus sp. T2V]